MSPGAAVALVRMLLEKDATDILPAIRVPTLVLHKRDDKVVPIDEGRDIAELVPVRSSSSSRVRPLAVDRRRAGRRRDPGVSHGVRDNTEPDRALVTVMFVDIVDSTKRAAELGDRHWTDLLEASHAIVRRDLDRYGGREVDTAGDGLFAIFDGPVRAIRCATALTEAVASLGLHIRTGIHTGECERIGGNVRGLGVVIGARVGALAGPGEILVSRTVQDLVVGSGLIFDHAGEHELKGIPDRWRLYRVAYGASAPS